VVMHFAGCGSCKNCLQGKPSYCLSHRLVNFGGRRADGSTSHHRISNIPNVPSQEIFGNFFRQSSFATYALCTQANVVRVPKDLPLEQLAPLGCAVNTGAGAILNSLRVGSGSSVAIFGAGAVGLSALLAAVVVGAHPIFAVDLHEHRLKLATELGATHVINVKDADALQVIRSLTGGVGVEFSLDTTGNPSVLRTAVESLLPLGVCGLVGGSPPGSELKVDMLTILLGRTVRGIIQGDSVPKVFLEKLITLFSQGRFPFDKLTTMYDGLHQINQAASDSLRGSSIKAVLRLSSP